MKYITNLQPSFLVNLHHLPYNMPRYRKPRYDSCNERQYSNHPYAQEIMPTRLCDSLESPHTRFKHPYNPKPHRHSYGSSSDNSHRRHWQRSLKPPTALPHTSNPRCRNIHNSRYNDTIRDILTQAAIVESNVSHLVERLQWLAPDEEAMSWQPSSVVYTLNRSPTQEQLDRMVEARLLSVVREGAPAMEVRSAAVGLDSTAMSGIEESRDSDTTIAKAEEESKRKKKEGQGFAGFGCGDGNRGALF